MEGDEALRQPGAGRTAGAGNRAPVVDAAAIQPLDGRSDHRIPGPVRPGASFAGGTASAFAHLHGAAALLVAVFALGEVDLRRVPANPAIRTIFSDSAGEVCGEHIVEFSQAGGPMKYLVDDPKLGDLLRLIGKCASAPTAEP